MGMGLRIMVRIMNTENGILLARIQKKTQSQIQHMRASES